MKQKVETTNGPRASLAAAIEELRDSEAHCAALRASVTRIEDQLYAAQGQIDRAREQDEEAKSAQVRAIVAGDDLMVLERPASSAVAQVERTISACKQARQMVRDELAEAERSAGYKAERVRDAAGAVVAAEALDAKIAKTERLQGELEAELSVLSYLHSQIPRDRAAMIEKALASSDVHGEHPAVAPWRAAIDALMADANAELPR